MNTPAPLPRRTILSVAFPYAPVGEPAVGGAEVVLSGLEAALLTLGFRSVVVAHQASRPSGRLYPVSIPSGEITDAVRSAAEKATQAAIGQALEEHPVALVHMHGLDFASYRVPAHLPVVVTLHLPPGWYPPAIWNLPENYHFVCVSETQRRACPSSVQNRVLVIGNGVPLPAPDTLRAGGRYALMLSRICPEKNLHVGLDAARRAGMPVLLAGEVFPYAEHERYFQGQIAPRLTRTGVLHERHSPASEHVVEARFLGPQTGAAKHRLISRAACLLLPSLAPETSSLAAMEALASGVPVVAMASGALPEIVDEGRTGFLIHPAPEAEAAQAMAGALQRLDRIDRRWCRAVAEQRFGIDRMLAEYAALYRELALPAATPERISNAGPGVDARTAIGTGVPGPVQATTSPALLAEQINSAEELAALVPTWTQLWDEDEQATPFQHPGWLLPWWAQFGSDGELSSTAIRGLNGALLALLPTYLYPGPQGGGRTLLWIGAGTTDYLNGIFTNNLALLPGKPSLEALLRNKLPPDTLALTQMPQESPLLQAASSAVSGPLGVVAGEPCSVIPLSRALPAKVRANTGRYRRRAEKEFPLHFSVATSVPEALGDFDELRRLQEKRWTERGEAGVLDDDRVVRHHQEAIPRLLDAGLLRFFRLHGQDQLLGVLYALADPPQRKQRALYLYLIGFDSHFAELSPGTLLLHAVHEYATKNGFFCLDLLRGGEAYKRLWGAEERPTFTLVTEPQAQR